MKKWEQTALPQERQRFFWRYSSDAADALEHGPDRVRWWAKGGFQTIYEQIENKRLDILSWLCYYQTNWING